MYLVLKPFQLAVFVPARQGRCNMKKLAILILVVLVPLGCVTAPSTGETEVEELMVRFRTGLGEENIELLMSTYWPEAQMVIKLPDGTTQQFSGIDQIREVQLGGFGDPNRQILGFSDPEREILSNSATYRIITHVPGMRVSNSFELTRRDGRWGIIHQMVEVLPPEEAGADTGGQRYPGPPEATTLLEAWEKAVRTHDLDLLKEIMPEPYLRYTQESGEEVAFQGFDACTAFRLDFFTSLGAREDYRLPPLGEYYKYKNFDVYKFEHEKPPTSEMIYLEKVEGRWRIDHIDMITWKNGPFVTNKLQALGDRNGDGFITPEDGSPTVSEMVSWFFNGPHECATAYDEFFDGNRDGFISEGELRQATEICFRRGLRFARDLGEGLTKDIDLNNDGGLDDGEIDRIADFMLGETELPLERGRFLNVLWWLPMPDALFQEVPREVSNYIDELADGNDDERIDQVEQEIIISSLTKGGEAVNYFERAIDRNRDGYINWNEKRLVMQSAGMGWSFRSSARPPFPVVTAVDALLDSNRDALVDAHEIQGAVVLFSGDPAGAVSVSQHLKALLDTDKNGSLDIGEIEMGKARLLFPRRIDSRNRTDRAWDLDDSGYLEASELGITAGDSNGNPVRAFNERIDLYRRQGEASRISREREEIAAGREVKPDIAAQGYRGRLQSLKGKYLVVLEVEAGLVALEPKITKILTTFIENAFVNLGSVIIVDRRNLDKIMDEISLQVSGLVDEGMAIKLGKLSGAEVIAAGEIDQLGDTYYLNVKLISVETGEILSCSMAKGQSTEEFLEMANQAVGRLF
jgi:Ca2+-binding EF-hand superfamily protein